MTSSTQHFAPKWVIKQLLPDGTWQSLLFEYPTLEQAKEEALKFTNGQTLSIHRIERQMTTTFHLEG
jgi:hypothetical protein